MRRHELVEKKNASTYEQALGAFVLSTGNWDISKIAKIFGKDEAQVKRDLKRREDEMDEVIRTKGGQRNAK